MTDATWADAIAMNDELAGTFAAGAAAWDRLAARAWSTYTTWRSLVVMVTGAVVVLAVAASVVPHWPLRVMFALCVAIAANAIREAVRTLGRVLEALQWRARCAAEQAEAAERANLCRAWSRVLAEL